MTVEQNGKSITNTSVSGKVVKESNMANFVADVVEESKNVPIIVEFFSPQSDASNNLSAILEKLVNQLGGIVKLAKVNLDENRQLAAQLQVQAVPTVFGFKNGQPIDGFAGSQSESQVKSFIKRLTGNAKAPIEEALEQAKALLENGNQEQALNLYGQILSQDEKSGVATGGLIRCYIASGEIEHAKALIEALEDGMLNDADVQAARSALELAEAGLANGDVEEFRNKLAMNKEDHQARFDLALSLYGSGQSQKALEELLEIIRLNRAWNDEAARKQMIKIFEALGAADPVTIQARRDLSTVLFS
jgi:putative thioredoxin